MRTYLLTLSLVIVYATSAWAAVEDPCARLFEGQNRIYAELDSPSVPWTEAQIQERLRGRVIVLTGAPGAGKGTQAQRLARRFGLHHISTGDLFRSEIKNGTDIGKAIEPIMKSGQLVPGVYAQAVLGKHLDSIDSSHGLLLDGVIRSFSDLADIEPVLKSKGLEIDSVIHLQITEDEATARLGGRRVCPSCKAGFHLTALPPRSAGACDHCSTALVTRADDVEATIRERFKLYRSVTGPLEEELAARDLLYSVSAESSPERMEAKIVEALLAPERFHGPQSAYKRLAYKLLEPRFSKDPRSFRRLLTDFRDASLEENQGKRTGQVRRFVFLQTENPSKLVEFTSLFDRYGIEVLKLPPSDHPSLVSTLLTIKSAELVPLAVLRESSRLLRPGSMQASTFRSGVRADHLSELKSFRLDDDGKLVESVYSQRTEGRVVETAHAHRDGVSVFGWDDRFEVLATGKTYHQQRLHGLKISSRDRVISEFMKDIVHYREPKNVSFYPARVSRPVSFEEDPAKFFSENPYYAQSVLKNFGLDGMLAAVLNEGIFIKAPKTRIQANYWQPGLNAGLPLVKKKDAIHQSTFMFHDLGHFLVPDLIFSGELGPRYREIYIIYRMMSEAITQFLADGLFVDSLAKSGFSYDYGARKIYPLFQDLGLDLSGEFFLPNLKRLLKANVEYVLKGDDSSFRAMLLANGKDAKNLEEFKKKYDPFFVSDFEWTAQNFDYMSKNASDVRRWWSQSAPLREASGVRFETIEEFSKELRVGDSSALIDSIFERVFEDRLAPALTLRRSLDLPAIRIKKAFFRYIIGQMGLLSKFDQVPETQGFRAQIIELMVRDSGQIDDTRIAKVRSLYEEYVQLLERKNLITGDDAANFKETYPLFNPFYVSYDKRDTYPDLKTVAQSVLDPENHRKQQLNAVSTLLQRDLSKSEKKYLRAMTGLIETTGGQVEDGLFVIKPGVELLSVSVPELSSDATYVTFILAGISVETSMELIAHGEANVARLTSSKTSAMNLPLYRVQGAQAGTQKEYLRSVLRQRSLFETRSQPRTRWENGNELFNLTQPGSKATALTYSMTLSNFHKLLIGRSGPAGNETEIQEIAREIAAQLHARFPRMILAPQEYLKLDNGAKNEWRVEVPKASGRGDGVHLISRTELTDAGRAILDYFKISPDASTPERLAEFRARLTYLAFESTSSPRRYLDQMIHELKHTSVLSADRLGFVVDGATPEFSSVLRRKVLQVGGSTQDGVGSAWVMSLTCKQCMSLVSSMSHDAGVASAQDRFVWRGFVELLEKEYPWVFLSPKE